MYPSCNWTGAGECPNFVRYRRELRLTQEQAGEDVGTTEEEQVDPRWAALAVAPDQALQGNLDPIALLAGGMALEVEARAILGAMRGRPYVFNLGHGIEKETPPEHVAALVRLVRAG